jgi:hypothetical protein
MGKSGGVRGSCLSYAVQVMVGMYEYENTSFPYSALAYFVGSKPLAPSPLSRMRENVSLPCVIPWYCPARIINHLHLALTNAF